MRGSSLTVGRSDQNDLVLPDPEKMISSRHCAIEDHGGNVVVIDFSTNGTFLNYGKMALGATPTPVNNGDILSIGPYELLIELSSLDAGNHDLGVALPLVADELDSGLAGNTGSVSDILDDRDDFLDDLLGGPTSGPAGVVRDQLDDDGLMPPMDDDYDLMAPEKDDNDSVGASHSAHSSPLADMIQMPATATSSIPDDWDLDSPSAPAPERIPAPELFEIPEDDDLSDFLPDDLMEETPQETPAPVIPEKPLVAPVREPIPVAAPLANSGDPARALLQAMGAGDLNIPEQEMEPTFARLGHVLRIMIHGVREILMTRSSIKSEFRISQTVISAGMNNPLKFSVSPEQAVESMIRPTTKGYLDAAAAAEEALKDIKAHEVAMMTGMEAALKGVLVKLEPSTLAKTIEADSSFRSVLTNKKARYWDTFEKKYEEIADQAENDFHDLFSKEFARAYQEQLEKLK
jgi:type VI secretion system protein